MGGFSKPHADHPLFLDLNNVILEKESTIKIMEQEVAAVKDFKVGHANLIRGFF
jgi:hypothetical protein